VIVNTGNKIWQDEFSSATCVNPITLILADRHTLFREGLRNLLSQESDIRIIGEADTGRAVLDLCIENPPSVLIMDFTMPILNAFEVTHAIQKKELETQIILLAEYLEVRELAQLISMGIKGFLCKQDDYKSLSLGIRVVNSGTVFFSETFSNRLDEFGYEEILRLPKFQNRWRCLTGRERETLKMISAGKSNKQIASLLDISIKTVEKHREKLMNKLDIHDTAGLVRFSLRSGLLEMVTS
jgi:DNA-binding NarL/FixJ family response regulator